MLSHIHPKNEKPKQSINYSYKNYYTNQKKVIKLIYMSSSRRGSVMFTIDIKVSGQNMSIPVYDGENYEELIKRFCEQHVFKADYKQAIKDKIIESLVETVKKTEISAQLKKKVNNFLNTKQQKQQIHSRRKSQKSSNPISNQSTPFKKIEHHSNLSNSQSKSVTNRHIGAHTETDQDKSLKQVNVKQYAKPVPCIRKNKVEQSKIANTAKSRASVSKPQDADLISAYEVIFKKSKQPQMKNMAKKFLEECGHLKQNTHEHKKKFDPSAQFRKLCQNQTSQKPSPHKPEQASAKPQSDIHSLTKFQLIQSKSKSKSKSPERHRNTPNKQNRIKYDLGQDIVCQKNDTQGLNYSRYGLGKSSSRERASVSYGRLPRQSPAHQQKSIRNSRNISSYNYDYDRYEQPERAISLRRTRKYKYL